MKRKILDPFNNTDFNRVHPELEDGEWFWTNVETEKAQESISEMSDAGVTDRQGKVAYYRNGTEATTGWMVPIFVNKEAYMKHVNR